MDSEAPRVREISRLAADPIERRPLLDARMASLTFCMPRIRGTFRAPLSLVQSTFAPLLH